MEELIGKTLLEGGALVVLVVLVIVWMREQRQERKESCAERVAMMQTLTDLQKQRDDQGRLAMQSGMASLDKVNGSIRDLVEVNVELSKVIAVHDTACVSHTETIGQDIKLILQKLDSIQTQLAARA